MLIGDFFICPASAPGPSRRLGLPVEVKGRLHRSVQKRLSGLNKELTLLF
ncbi:hypothetical protein GA0061094_0700 [[Bacillus] enclensis]|uniref:Uncharacterized protein n=1 Tax=[Bacillus] enclensis TaxID=1402860 RepID=A0A1C3ZGV6_9BACI|nr:hypothetical protein GA0061094_0700 [[Bacillus] enclensis]